MDTLNEMYESQWAGHDHMCTQSNSLDMLWSDYSHKLADQVLIPLNTYQAQFAETRVSYNCLLCVRYKAQRAESINALCLKNVYFRKKSTNVTAN